MRSEGAERGEFEVAYTIGVDPLQQYLVAFPDGRLQALHVAWDARPARSRWPALVLARSRARRGRRPRALEEPRDELERRVRRLPHDRLPQGIRRRREPVRLDLGRDRRRVRGVSRGGLAPRRVGARGREAIVRSRTRRADRAGATRLPTSPRPSREVDRCAACHSQRAQITEQPRAGDRLPRRLRARVARPRALPRRRAGRRTGLRVGLVRPDPEIRRGRALQRLPRAALRTAARRGQRAVRELSRAGALRRARASPSHRVPHTELVSTAT